MADYQIVTYQGDGVNGRSIPTAVSPNAVLLFPYGGADDNSLIRVDDPAMTWTQRNGSTTAVTNAILSMGAGGFTLGHPSSNSPVANPNAPGRDYIALALAGTVIGTYIGNGVDNRVLGGNFSNIIIFGRSWAYRSAGGFTGDSSMLLNNDGSPTFSNMIQSVSDLEVGTDTDVNQNTRDYGYVELDFPGSVFTAFTGTGTGANLAVSGFGFTPIFVMVNCMSTAGGSWGARYRGKCSHTGTQSQISGGGVDGSTGIRSMDADGVTLGTALSRSGVAFHGFAFGVYNGGSCSDGVGGGSAGSTGSQYTYSESGVIGCQTTLSPGTDSGGGAGCNPTLTSGADSGGGSGCQVDL